VIEMTTNESKTSDEVSPVQTQSAGGGFLGVLRRHQYSIARYVGLVLVVVGLAIGCPSLRRVEKTSRWPKVRGVMLGASYHEITGPPIRAWDTWITVNYQYEVNGQSYHGDAINAIKGGDHGELPPEVTGSKKTDASDFVNRHGQGTGIDVYYDPNNPGDAVLFPGFSGRYSIAVPMFGCLLSVFGVLSFVAASAKVKKIRISSSPDRSSS